MEALLERAAGCLRQTCEATPFADLFDDSAATAPAETGDVMHPPAATSSALAAGLAPARTPAPSPHGDGLLGNGEMPTTGGNRARPVDAMRRYCRSLAVEPTRIRIAAIGVDARVETTAIVNGVMQDPANTTVVAWYNQLSTLNAYSGNVVMAGYFRTNMIHPAVFSRLEELRRGDEIEVVGSDGTTFVYAVDATRTEADRQRVAIADVVGPTTLPSLTLTTGAAPYDPRLGDYGGITVVRAHLVRRAGPPASAASGPTVEASTIRATPMTGVAP